MFLNKLSLLIVAFLISQIICLAKAECFRPVSASGELIQHSDVVAMFNVDDPEILKKYCIDIVAWGNHLPWPNAGEVYKRQNIIKKASTAGVRYHGVDMALMQEGKRYLAKSLGRWKLPDIESLNKEDIYLKKIKERSVLDVNGNLTSLTWMKPPIACIHDKGYRKWLINRIDWLMETNPTSLHFDEPLLGAICIMAKKPGCFCDKCCENFGRYLKTRPEAVWKMHGINSLKEFNYRDFVKSKGICPRKAPLWDEFVKFQILSAAEFVEELKKRADLKANTPFLFSANAPPYTWEKLPFLHLMDYISSEFAHYAKLCRVPDRPILAYKLGDCLHKPIFSTALGSDWSQIKKYPHALLVCSWIAQAYAYGHQFMMPIRACAFGSQYYPTTDHYACLANWIKKVKYLLDGYESISDTAVVLKLDSFKKERDKKNIIQLCSILAHKNILYHIVIQGNDFFEKELTIKDFEGCSQTIIALPVYFTDKELSLIKKFSGNGVVLMADEKAIKNGIPSLQHIDTPIKTKEAKSVFALPRIKTTKHNGSSLVFHLLNRDYDAEKFTMKPKGPFKLIVKNNLLFNHSVSKAVLHQPILSDKLKTEKLGVFQELAIKQMESKIEITVPFIDLWGIIELL